MRIQRSVAQPSAKESMDSRTSDRSPRVLGDEPEPDVPEPSQLETKPEAVSSNDDMAPSKAEPEWLMGIKLYFLMTGITTICFLMLMDISIIATV